MVPRHRATQQEAGDEMPAAIQCILFLLQSMSTSKPVARPASPARSWSFSWTQLLQAFFHLDVVGPVTLTWEVYVLIFRL